MRLIMNSFCAFSCIRFKLWSKWPEALLESVFHLLLIHIMTPAFIIDFKIPSEISLIIVSRRSHSWPTKLLSRYRLSRLLLACNLSALTIRTEHGVYWIYLTSTLFHLLIRMYGTQQITSNTLSFILVLDSVLFFFLKDYISFINGFS